MQLTERSLKDLKAHPLNPRRKTAESVEEMRASIAQHGLLQPLVVKPDGTVLSGHRRLWALEALGEETAPCNVVDGENEGKALELLLVSNEHVERPDPIIEAEAVAELLAMPGWTVTSIAGALGRTVKWVARRAQLRNLAPKALDLTRPGKPWDGWPVEWLEQIAILAKGAQETFAGRFRGADWQMPRIDGKEDLDALLAEELQVLGKAAFDIHDPDLVPRAGACVSLTGSGSCKKTTISRPGLFDDDIAGDEKTARCCDSGCWAQKLKAHVAARIAAAKATHGKDLVVVEPQGTYGESVRTALKGVNHLPHWQVTACKGNLAGARPALQIEGDGSVKEIHVRGPDGGGLPSRSKASAKGANTEDERTPAQKLKDSKEGIHGRRKAHVVDAVREWLEKEENEATSPSWNDTRELLVRFNTEPQYKYDDKLDKKNLDEIAAIAADDLRLVRELWPRLRMDIAEKLKRWGGNSNIGPKYELALWVAPKLGLGVVDLQQAAIGDVPDPKWWPESASTPSPAVAAMNAGRKAAAAATKKSKAKKPRAAAAKVSTKKRKR